MFRSCPALFSVLIAAGTAWAALTTDAPSTAPHYGLFEMSITHPSGSYGNVWEQVSVTARFTPPSGAAITVDGFFDTTNTWKVRFCPALTGAYTWKVHLVGNSTDSATGSFQSTDSNERGFIRKHPGNPLRMVYEKDGGLYNAMGLSACFTEDMEGSLDERQVSWSTYLDYMFDTTGFNLFRVSIGNCALKLWESIENTTGTNRSKALEGRVTDRKLIAMRQRGVRIMFDALGWEAMQYYTTLPDFWPAIDRYWRYVVARYGAIVDIWELCNETSPSDAWVSHFAQYVKSIDPYHHMVSVSWERPSHPDIDIDGPHLYANCSPQDADRVTGEFVDPHRAHGKPIIYGEYGNSSCNVISNNALQARCRAWTAFFREAALAWWEMNWSDHYCPGNGAANLYVGPDERRYFRHLQRFTTNLDPGARVGNTWSYTSSAGMRGYELRSDSSVYIYVKDTSSFTRTVSDLRVTFQSPGSGTAYWFSPQTGDTLGQAAVTSGSRTLTAPSFTLDIALKLEVRRATAVAGPAARSASPRSLLAKRATAAYDLRGRTVAGGTAGRSSGVVIVPAMSGRAGLAIVR